MTYLATFGNSPAHTIPFTSSLLYVVNQSPICYLAGSSSGYQNITGVGYCYLHSQQETLGHRGHALI